MRGLSHPRFFDFFDVGKLGIGFQGASDGSHPNLGGSGTPQNPGALRGGSSGGEDVIDQHNLLPCDEARMLHTKGPAEVLAALMAGEAERGILICGSGVGVCVAANKMPGVRAGMCHDSYSAHQGVEHDEMNVLVLGARIVGASLAYECVDAYLQAKFIANEPRFVRRLNKVKAIEQTYMPSAAGTLLKS